MAAYTKSLTYESESSSADEYTKRNREDKEEVFRKSKKVIRTPPKPYQDKGMEEIKEMLAKLGGELAFIREKMDNLDKIGEAQKQVLQEVQELRQENRKITEVNERLKERVDRIIYTLENKNRRKNIIIRGLPNKEKKTAKDIVKEMLQSKMQVLIVPEEMKVIDSINDKIVVMQLKSLEKKKQILKSKNKLA